MAELVQANWIFLVIALVVGLIVAWWIFVANRRTSVTLEKPEGEEAAPAKRNQALIDAPPAAAPKSDPGEDLPPVTPMGMAGIGEAVAAAARPIHVEGTHDDLTRIKGVGPKLAQQLQSMGIVHFTQIADWDDDEIDRIDAQLGRFQGRIRRDSWPEQARLLCSGDTAAYEAKFGKL